MLTQLAQNFGASDEQMLTWVTIFMSQSGKLLEMELEWLL